MSGRIRDRSGFQGHGRLIIEGLLFQSTSDLQVEDREETSVSDVHRSYGPPVTTSAFTFQFGGVPTVVFEKTDLISIAERATKEQNRDATWLIAEIARRQATIDQRDRAIEKMNVHYEESKSKWRKKFRDEEEAERWEREHDPYDD